MKRFDQFHFAENLARVIDDKGYSVKDVADYLDVSVQAVYGWLYGTRMPKIDNLIPLADLIDRSLDDLLPSYEAEWDGASINGKTIEQRHLEERTHNHIDIQNYVR